MKVFKSPAAREAMLKDYDRLLKLWGVPYAERDIQNDCGSTHVILAGDPKNPPLVLLHGVGDNSVVMWLYNIRALTQKYYCAAIDTIGGPGKSLPGPKYQKGFDQQAWLDGVFDALGFDRFHIAGVSNGAVMALAYACLRERADKLVMIEGGPVTSTKTAWKTMLKAFPEALFPTRGNVLKLMKKFAHPRENFFEQTPDVTEQMILIMRAHNQMAMAYQKPWLYDSDRARKLRGRALCLMGEYACGADADFVALCRNEGFAVEIIKDAGHGVNMEQYETVNRILLDFLG